MKRRLLILAVALLVFEAPFLLNVAVGNAQVITSDPIQTVPGEPGCGGNTTYQYLGQGASITCANQRTFHFGTITRTVVARSTMNSDGTASTTFTVTGGNAPADIPLAIRSHIGNSDGTVVSEVTGVIPKGTAGPVTLTYAFDCGQVDVKAVFTANGNGNGRISGGAFCKYVPVETTTTAPTTPAPVVTVGPSVTTGATPSVAAGVRGALPPTGNGNAWEWALVAVAAGAALVVVGRYRKTARAE